MPLVRETVNRHEPTKYFDAVTVNERGIGERHIVWDLHDVNALFAFAKHVVRLVSGVGESLYDGRIVEGDIVFHDG